MIKLLAALWLIAITLLLCAVAIKLAATGETDWPMLAAGLLLLPGGVVTWRRARQVAPRLRAGG